jgi:hypothetical protein
MSIQPWRDIGYAKWDSLSALEDPKSAEFKAAVKSEDALWSHGLQQIPKSRLRFWRSAMRRYQKEAHPVSRKYAEVRFSWCGHTVAKQRGPAGYTTHLWIDGWHSETAWSAVGFGSYGWFYTLEDIGNGAEHLELTVWEWPAKAAKPRKVWTKDPVGPSVEIVGNQIYFSSVENLLRYKDVWVAPVDTGAGAKCIFQEPDKRFQVSIIAREETLFVHKANALHQMLGVLVKDTIQWIAEELSTLIPIGMGWYGTNNTLVNYITLEEVPLPKGEYLVDAMIRQEVNPSSVSDSANRITEGSTSPSRPFGYIRKVNREGLFVVTTYQGRETLWLWQNNWTVLQEGYSTDTTIMNAIQIFHEPTLLPTFLLRAPMIPDTVGVYDGTSRELRSVLKYPEPLEVRYFGGGLAKGNVPYTWVSAVRNPKALLVEAYGAYGISSRRAYPTRWLPYLATGWAIAYLAPRGGREGGDAWWDAARGAVKKHRTFEDTAAGIRALQDSLHISPGATVFFGRSAGGWLAANIAQEHGNLVAAVYAEVPYVDVLRTTSNPALPLTQLEYDEFGDPRRPEEYRALQKISPVDTVPLCKGGCPLLVIRTALHDKQVLPYEALKWAARLREAGWDRVYVGLDHDGGHFASAKSMAEQRAEDGCFLESALTDAPRRGARNGTRKKRKQCMKTRKL